MEPDIRSVRTMKVSVLLITHNHGPFIAQAIESALMQRTSFDYEIVIGEDLSTDNTREIVRSYAEARPDLIRPLFRERNIGGRANGAATLAACRGEYVAILEGDDYWISDQKLEKQVALLETHPDSDGCFANAIVVDEAGKKVSPDYYTFWGHQPKPEIRAEDILPFGVSPANTILCRRAVLANAPVWYKKFPTHCGLDLLLSLNGPYLYLDEKMGAYRLHSGSGWTAKSESFRIASDLRYLKNLYGDSSMRGKYGPKLRYNIEQGLDCLLGSGSIRPRAEVLPFFIKFLVAPPWKGELISMAIERLFRRFVNLARQRLRPSV